MVFEFCCGPKADFYESAELHVTITAATFSDIGRD